MSRFLAIGECMIELAACPDGRYKMGFAGDTFNTAWYVRKVVRSGLEVAYLTAVGDDRLSMQMLRFMADAGVQPEVRVRKKKTIGLYVISLDSGERSFSYWRNDSAARTLADDLHCLPGVKSGDMAYFSGITLAILPEAGRLRLLGILASGREAGVTIAFDPNIRPRLWATSGETRHWITEGAKASDIVLPSFEDEAALFGDESADATARRYMAVGPKTVVVKDGYGPVLARTAEDGVQFVPDPIDKPVDTTAAGDSFNAGFLACSMRGVELDEAVAFGCEVAGKVISSHGALVPLRLRTRF